MAGVKPLLETIGALLPKGIKTWHASPHDFDKYDISKLRTGQGAASYGEGIYQAESPLVSGQGGQYWDEFLNRLPDRSPEANAAVILKRNQFDRDKAIAELQQHVASIKEKLTLPAPDRVWREMLPHYEKQLEIMQKPGGQVGPRVYETAIHAKPEQILDWDAPLSKQPAGDVWGRLDKGVRDQIDEALDVRGVNTMSDVPEEYTGKDLYKWMNSYDVEVPIVKRGGDMAEQSVQVMDYLNSIDLPVTRYLDQKSRNPVAPKSYYDALATARSRLAQAEAKGAPQWELQGLKQSVDDADARVRREKAAFPQTRNYVVRDDKFLEILRKLAIPGLVGGGGAISAYKPQGSQ